MFRNLRFAHRVLLMPGLAAAGLVLILAAAQVLGARTGRALTAIQQGFAPALDTARDLQGELDAIRHDLQDAGTARDTSILAEADQKHRAFLDELKKTAANPAIPAAERQSIARAVDDYYQLARRNTQSTIATGTVSENAGQQIDRYNKISETLKDLPPAAAPTWRRRSPARAPTNACRSSSSAR
ncbi:MAG: hypothetical protein JOZ15_19040 [Acidobacteria bacterium]|nr:hypothetical protein [Acidobacteriota bacterium]